MSGRRVRGLPIIGRDNGNESIAQMREHGAHMSGACLSGFKRAGRKPHGRKLTRDNNNVLHGSNFHMNEWRIAIGDMTRKPCVCIMIAGGIAQLVAKPFSV